MTVTGSSGGRRVSVSTGLCAIQSGAPSRPWPLLSALDSSFHGTTSACMASFSPVSTRNSYIRSVSRALGLSLQLPPGQSHLESQKHLKFSISKPSLCTPLVAQARNLDSSFSPVLSEHEILSLLPVRLHLPPICRLDHCREFSNPSLTPPPNPLSPLSFILREVDFPVTESKCLFRGKCFGTPYPQEPVQIH